MSGSDTLINTAGWNPSVFVEWPRTKVDPRTTTQVVGKSIPVDTQKASMDARSLKGKAITITALEKADATEHGLRIVIPTGQTKKWYVCNNIDCGYASDRVYHAKMHVERVHFKNGKPMHARRKFCINIGEEAKKHGKKEDSLMDTRATKLQMSVEPTQSPWGAFSFGERVVVSARPSPGVCETAKLLTNKNSLMFAFMDSPFGIMPSPGLKIHVEPSPGTRYTVHGNRPMIGTQSPSGSSEGSAALVRDFGTQTDWEANPAVIEEHGLYNFFPNDDEQFTFINV